MDSGASRQTALWRGAACRRVPRRGGMLVAAAAAAMLAMASGCCQLRPEQAALGEQVPVDEFLHQHLQQESAVTVAEAYRAMVMLVDGEDDFDNFEEREAYLMGRGIVRPSWHLRRDAVIDRGSVSYMVLKILDVGGGVNMRLLGRLPLADRRYAHRELIYMGLVAPVPDYRYITGGELVHLMGRADDYMAAHKLYEAGITSVDELLPEGPSAAPQAEP